MKILFFILLISNFLYSEKIMIIGSYHDEYPWQQEYKNALINNLDDYEIYSFNLDSKRLELKDVMIKVQEAIDFVDEINPDIVLLGDDNAFSYLADEIIYRNIDVVFLGINENLRDYYTKRPERVTGVLSRPYYKRAILSVDNIVNSAKNILILFDSSSTSQKIIEENFIGVEKVYDIDIHTEVIYNFDEWKRVIEASKNGYDAIIIGSYQKIKDNNIYIDGKELMRWTSENSPLPIFSFWAFGVGANMSIGGLVVSGETQGVEASKIVKMILEEGKKPKEIFPVSVLGGKYLFSREQLKKWQLSLSEDILKKAEFTD